MKKCNLLCVCVYIRLLRASFLTYTNKFKFNDEIMWYIVQQNEYIHHYSKVMKENSEQQSFSTATEKKWLIVFIQKFKWRQKERKKGSYKRLIPFFSFGLFFSIIKILQVLLELLLWICINRNLYW